MLTDVIEITALHAKKFGVLDWGSTGACNYIWLPFVALLNNMPLDKCISRLLGL
jgi:hypothetical protein